MAEDTPTIPETLPVVATTNLVLFPFMLVPLSVGREASLKAVDAALQADRIVALTLQSEDDLEAPTPQQMNEIGCAAAIVRMQRTPEGAQVIVQGLSRVRLSDFDNSGEALRARVEPLTDAVETTPEIEVQVTTLLERFRQIVELSPVLPDEAFEAAQAQNEPGKLADFVASALNIDPPVRQELLDQLDVLARVTRVNELAQSEINVLEVTRQVSEQTREELDKGQRDFILRQQLREIQKQLGEGDNQEQEIEELRAQVEAAQMPEEPLKAATRELERLARIPSASPEYSVTRNYLDYLIAVPWSKSTNDNLDIKHAAQVLADEHYGLQDAKDRILEYLAVRRLAPDSKGPILCLVGPPGVGKTSLAHSIANALGRKFVRMALGGVRDEAEIRGHRRTYIGALPGRIVQGLRDAGTNNPVMILDEIDKLGSDYRGDPTSALLEVLDPQQNHAFRDHYLEVPMDLSKVMFITTANVLDTIPGPLRDRMEIIRIPGYTEEEKRFIAERYLLPRQMKENGLSPASIEFTTSAIEGVVRGYTREAGVRSLERELGRVCRKVARQVAEREGLVETITEPTINELLDGASGLVTTSALDANTNVQNANGAGVNNASANGTAPTQAATPDTYSSEAASGAPIEADDNPPMPDNDAVAASAEVADTAPDDIFTSAQTLNESDGLGSDTSAHSVAPEGDNRDGAATVSETAPDDIFSPQDGSDLSVTHALQDASVENAESIGGEVAHSATNGVSANEPRAKVAGFDGVNGVAHTNGVADEVAPEVAPKITGPKIVVTEESLEEYLGPVRFTAEMAGLTAQVGVATGMAWTPVGGEILFIESALMPGKGGLTVTGQLGDVMRESVKIALDYLRAHGSKLGVDASRADEQEIHVHVPAGAIPKDGPSAGVAMTTALASLLSGRPARHDIAMTGEVTLTGRVLPIGGVKEKVLAARQAGISEIILPERNRSDLRDIPDETRGEMTFHFVSDVREAVNIVLLPQDAVGVAVSDGAQNITTPTEQDTALTDPAMPVSR